MSFSPCPLHKWPLTWFVHKITSYRLDIHYYIYPFSSMCGGTLIDNWWVVTAAHCLWPHENKFNVSYINAYFADLDPNKEDTCEDYRLMNVEFFVHEKFNGNAEEGYDIGLIKLRQRLEMSPFIKSIKLWEKGVDEKMKKEHSMLIASGYGADKYDKKTWSEELKYAKFKMLDWKRCQQILQTKGLSLHKTHLCTMSHDNDACQGDSGGPLVYIIDGIHPTRLPQNPNGDQPITRQNNEVLVYLVGIISLGYRCAESGVPGVYTDVRQLRSWIGKKIGGSQHIPDFDTKSQCVLHLCRDQKDRGTQNNITT